MKIILVRHGDYTPHIMDPTEGLSEIGEQQVKELKEKLEENNITFDRIISSPKLRAYQTASILSGEKDVEINDLLKGGQDPKRILEHIIGLDRSVLLVGHNPYMETLCSYLGESVIFQTSTCAIFENGKLIDVL